MMPTRSEGIAADTEYEANGQASKRKDIILGMF
jgi:hypothetical protein